MMAGLAGGRHNRSPAAVIIASTQIVVSAREWMKAELGEGRRSRCPTGAEVENRQMPLWR